MEYIKLNSKVKLRELNKKKSGKNAKGVTIPKIISDKLGDTYFNVTMSGTTIILESGCKND